MSLIKRQLLVGVAFQPRKKVAIEPELLNRGWKAAPTEITPSLNDIALQVAGYGQKWHRA